MYFAVDSTGDLLARLCTHVDDPLFASTPEGDRIIQHVLDAFRIGKVEKGTFRFCGRQYAQSPDFSITVNVRHNTRAIRPVQTLLAVRALSLSLRSVQTQVATATVSTLHECTRVLDLAMRDANRGLTFKSETLDWRKDLAICTFAAASFVPNRV